MSERIDLFGFSLVRTLKLRTENLPIQKKKISYGEKKKNEDINMSGLDK